MTSAAPDRTLVVRGITKEYPGTTALSAVDLTVEPGQVVALLGENGAGKSTLSGVIAGLTEPTAGTMTWGGEPYAPTGPGDAIAAGIGMIHQEMRLLPERSVAENVMVGRWNTRGAGFVSDADMAAEARVHLDRLGFTGRVEQNVGGLSVAGQQQVEIAKALALRARLLILDEPTAALGTDETDALFETIAALRAEGVSFIYVSHRLAEIARIADRIVVLRDGKLVGAHDSGRVPPAQLVREMVGREVARLFPDVPAPGPDAEVVLSVRDLRSPEGRFEGVDFDVRAGEIFGIAGIVGAGRTEVVRAVAGADPFTGTVTVDGAALPGGLRAAIDAGIVLVPEDRKQQGLIVEDSIEDNIALANLDDVVGRGGWITPARVRALAAGVAERFGIKGRIADHVGSLSGGNQQKVVLGKWLHRRPRVVILDEPTRGIDVGARSAIYDLVAELTAAGTAVVVVSSDLEEILGLAHRLVVLARGRVQGELSGVDMTGDNVVALATV